MNKEFAHLAGQAMDLAVLIKTARLSLNKQRLEDIDSLLAVAEREVDRIAADAANLITLRSA